MLEEINRYAEREQDFGFESTLAGRTYVTLLRKLKRKGYAVHIYFLWVPSADLALSRVRQRVLQGGHDVPERALRRRFDRSMRNFFTRYQPLATDWYLFDNSGSKPLPIASGAAGRLRVQKKGLYTALIRRYRQT